MPLTDRAMEVLRSMIAAEERKDYEEAEIVCDGIVCYRDLERISSRTVKQLLRYVAISPVNFEGGCRLYTVNDTGRAISRRPELADEVAAVLMGGTGSFTIRDDRIVPL